MLGLWVSLINIYGIYIGATLLSTASTFMNCIFPHQATTGGEDCFIVEVGEFHGKNPYVSYIDALVVAKDDSSVIFSGILWKNRKDITLNYASVLEIYISIFITETSSYKSNPKFAPKINIVKMGKNWVWYYNDLKNIISP